MQSRLEGRVLLLRKSEDAPITAIVELFAGLQEAEYSKEAIYGGERCALPEAYSPLGRKMAPTLDSSNDSLSCASYDCSGAKQYLRFDVVL